MNSNKFRLYKKGGMEDMPISEGVIGPILTLVVIIAISLFLFALWNWYNGNQEDQASINNLDELSRRIESLKDGEEITHPISLKIVDKIYGFEKDKNYISGNCRLMVDSEFKSIAYTIQKPIISCGSKGCLCLCKKDIACTEAYCKPSKFSIVGGKLVEEKKTDFGIFCDYAHVSGVGGVRNIYLKREGKTVRLCPAKCS